MSALTSFTLRVLLLVCVFGWFAWGKSKAERQLADTRTALQVCQTTLTGKEQAVQALRGLSFASQENCARAMQASQSLLELALPPTDIFPDNTSSLASGMRADQDAAGVLPPAASAAAASNAPTPIMKVNDHAFTDFLNTF